MKFKNRVHDLTGQRFGMLTVVDIDYSRDGRKTYWICTCDCGNTKSVRGDSLLCGAIQSCGCMKKRQDRINLTKNHSHKMSGTRIYGIWQKMRARCYNKSETCWPRYGGRGITVCDEWNKTFQPFYDWSIENGYAENLSIDRIDNDGPYSPENCRWTTNKEQSRNRRSNVNITIGNSTKTLTEWCEIFEVSYGMVQQRYRKHPDMSIEELFRPSMRKTS